MASPVATSELVGPCRASHSLHGKVKRPHFFSARLILLLSSLACWLKLLEICLCPLVISPRFTGSEQTCRWSSLVRRLSYLLRRITHRFVIPLDRSIVVSSCSYNRTISYRLLLPTGTSFGSLDSV